MTNNPIHTVPSKKKDGWVNVKAKNNSVLSKSKKKETAEKIGRSQAKKEKIEHFIHNKNGKIGEKNSYGNDNFPPKG